MQSLRVLVVALASANALSLLTPRGLDAARALRPPSACLTRLRCCAVESADEDSKPLSAYDLSSELAKYNTPGLRARQSGPIRGLIDMAAAIYADLRRRLRWLEMLTNRVPRTVWMMTFFYILQSPMLRTPMAFRKVTRLVIAVVIGRKLLMRRIPPAR